MRSYLSWKPVFTNIITLLTGTTLARGLSAIAMVVIARQLGPEAYGQYSASIALVALTTVLFSLGLDAWLLYTGGREPAQLSTNLTSALFLKSTLGIIWLMAWWIIAPSLDQSSFPRILISLAALALWLEEIALLAWNAFKARLRNDLTLILMLFSQGAFLVISLWLATQHVREPAPYMGGKFLAALLGAGVSGILVARRLGLNLHRKSIPASFRGTLPFAVSVAFTVIYGRADLAIVAGKLGEKAAGIYAPALTLTNVLFFVPAAVYGVMVPTLSRGYHENTTSIKHVSLRFTLSMALLGAALGIGLTLLSRPIIILLYGPSFQTSSEVFAILAAVVALRCPTTALAALLVAVGWQSRRVGVQGICAALNVLLNLLIIDTAGVLGVARVYVFTETVLLLGHLGMFILWTRTQEANP